MTTEHVSLLQGKSPVEYARWMASKEEGLAA